MSWPQPNTFKVLSSATSPAQGLSPFIANTPHTSRCNPRAARSLFPPADQGMCSAPLLSSIIPLQGSWQGAAGPRLTAQLSSAQPLASIVLSLGPRPKPAEIPEGKYLGNGLQTTIAFKSQSKPSTGETASPGNILCTKHGQLLAGYFMTHTARSDEKVQSAPVLGGTWGPISSCGFWTAGHSGGAQKPNTGDNSTGPVESQDNQRSSRVLEQKMCMEQPFMKHSGLCRGVACGRVACFFGSIAEGKEWMHPILACNTKGWLLGNGFSLSYSHPWTGSGASIKAALPLHAAEPPLHSHPCPQLPHLRLWHSDAVGRNNATGTPQGGTAWRVLSLQEDRITQRTFFFTHFQNSQQRQSSICFCRAAGCP